MSEVNSERSRGSGNGGPSTQHVNQAFLKFYPSRYREDLTAQDKR